MKQKIAVLGGGMGALTAVFELTSVTGWKDRWDVTVYQEGWRLGGKGASGRNAGENQRIEEHGLHILFGFYDNAFRVMRACHRELARHPDAPLSTFEKAFEPGEVLVLQELVDGEWVPWVIEPPKNDEVPGESGPGLEPADYVTMLLRFAAEQVEVWLGLAPQAIVVRRPGFTAVSNLGPGSTLAHTDIRLLRDLVRRLVREEGRPSLVETLTGALGEVLAAITGGAAEDLKEVLFVDIAHKLAQTKDHEDHDAIVWLLDRFDAFLWSHPMHTTELRRLRMMIDFSLALARGLVADRLIVPPVDWFALDHLEMKQWLRKHGAHEDTLESPLIKGLYDAAFTTFEPAAAGTSLHAFLRMAFTFKGALYYRMQAGMGDTIFAPLYEVLRRRGVKFEFFHQVESIETDGSDVSRLRIRRQATPIGGDYKPLVDVKGLPCWPSEPHYDQLEEGAALEASSEDLEDWWTAWPGAAHDRDVTLERGRDFDLVLLGISIGAFPYVAKDLMAANARFRAMVDNVKTTQTRCAQLWMTPDLEGLGWSGKPPVTIPYAEPLDTWADMTHLVKMEDWPPATVGHLAYLCSPMEDETRGPLPPRSDHAYSKRQTKRVKEYTREWLKTRAGALWPFAASTHDPDEINWALLVDRKERDGEERLEAQYWRAPLSPSERYVLAVPGSSAYRLRADESGFANLFLCGDWTKNAMSIGCLESAVMGGIQAARAIDPRVPKALGDWLPDRPRPMSVPMPEAPAPQPVHVPAAPARRSERELPMYIVTDANEVAPPPIKIDVTVSMFLLDADLDRLQSICDTQLNLPGSPVRYVPLGPFATLYCSHVDNYPQVNPIGWVPEKDFGIWVPLVAGRGEGRHFVPERIVTYTPYIWVDSGAALIGGRTVFGFAKQMADMVLPQNPGERADYSLDTLVVEKYAPDARAENKRLLTIRRRDEDVLGELRDAWRSGQNLLEAFGERLEGVLAGRQLPVPSWAFARDLIHSVVGDSGRPSMRMVFLKQFPDAHDGERACYQAIVEAELPIVSSVQGGYLHGDWEVEIRRYDSHQLVDTLGLKPRTRSGNAATMPSLLHGWSKFSAMVQKATIVHQAT